VTARRGAAVGAAPALAHAPTCRFPLHAVHTQAARPPGGACGERHLVVRRRGDPPATRAPPGAFATNQAAAASRPAATTKAALGASRPWRSGRRSLKLHSSATSVTMLVSRRAQILNADLGHSSLPVYQSGRIIGDLSCTAHRRKSVAHRGTPAARGTQSKRSTAASCLLPSYYKGAGSSLAPPLSRARHVQWARLLAHALPAAARRIHPPTHVFTRHAGARATSTCCAWHGWQCAWPTGQHDLCSNVARQAYQARANQARSIGQLDAHRVRPPRTRLCAPPEDCNRPAGGL
jgi:hypothetical protein